MKKNINISPVGLKGNEINERMKQLMGIQPINENKSNIVIELTKMGPDGNAYAIVRENHEWYIKKANKTKNLVAEDFKYIGGLQNKKQEAYPSYAKAIKHLNLKFRSLAEAYNYDGEINVFLNDNLLNENMPMAGGFAEMKTNGFTGEGNLYGNKPMDEMYMDEAKSKNNPWAICTASVGREDKQKYEACVMDVKKKMGMDEMITKEEYSDPTKSEMLDTLKQEFGGFEGYDNFSAEEAIYWYAYNNHGGQNSNLYSTLSTSTYKPSPLMKNAEDIDDDMAISMYNTLVDKFGGEEIGHGDYELDGDIEMTEYEKAIDEMIAKDNKKSFPDLTEYIVPDWAMSALINGDYTGLSDEDEQKLEMFIDEVIKQNGNANFMLGDIDGKDNLGFKHSNDIDNLGSNVYRVYIKPDEEIEMTEYKKAIDEMIAKEELKGGQKKLDVNKNGKLDAEDFKKLRAGKKGMEEEFQPHGSYTISNHGGYEVMLSPDGEMAKVRDAYGSDNPETSDWLEIEYVYNEETGELEPVIDPNGYNIPLNMVMRINEMTAKEKKFAALAEPKDKITYADKIAGAKKGEVKESKLSILGALKNMDAIIDSLTEGEVKKKL